MKILGVVNRFVIFYLKSFCFVIDLEKSIVRSKTKVSKLVVYYVSPALNIKKMQNKKIVNCKIVEFRRLKRCYRCIKHKKDIGYIHKTLPWQNETQNTETKHPLKQKITFLWHCQPSFLRPFI